MVKYIVMAAINAASQAVPSSTTELVAPEPGKKESTVYHHLTMHSLTSLFSRALSWPRVRASRLKRCLSRLSQPEDLSSKRKKGTRSRYPSHHRASEQHQAQDPRSLRQGWSRQVYVLDPPRSVLCAALSRSWRRHYGHRYLWP